ncbi:hypothetical protein CK203_026068 [Vitis vinifera]|uniref:Retrotransposon gag domain-containing protein n=1 Tax=Vitis vinifera TaxID=29760 RepID=A0A438IJ93_VITVI|nr:hypothetical protein CK203_026068 [Vitis vinifera]
MSFQDKVMTMFASVESRMEALAARMDARDKEIRQELAIYKTAVSARVMATHEAPRVEVPKPHTFNGKRDAKELDNFLWHMERYFEAIALMDEATKVRTTTLYLTDNATLWWRRRFSRHRERDVHHRHMGCLEKRNREAILSRRRGLPSKEEFETSQAHGLDSVRRRGVQDLATAMVVAKSLVDYRRGDSSKPKPPSKGNQAKVGETRGRKAILLRKDQARALVARMAKARTSRRSSCPGPIASCAMVRTGHGIAPKRKALNAMIEEKEQEGDAKVGSLQLLNALKAKPMPKTPQSKGLMYVEALVNGKATKALVDTGATHNFVSEDEARRLDLQASKEGGWLKAVNSAAKPSHGVARGVTMHIGSWEGRVDFTVAPMDDFKMVLGMDFLQKVKAMPLPFLYSMAILEEEKSCMVPTVTEGTLKTPMLSTMQVKKGLKREKVTYLATLKEERDDRSGGPMPKEIEGLLDEFKDVMPAQVA